MLITTNPITISFETLLPPPTIKNNSNTSNTKFVSIEGYDIDFFIRVKTEKSPSAPRYRKNQQDSYLRMMTQAATVRKGNMAPMTTTLTRDWRSMTKVMSPVRKKKKNFQKLKGWCTVLKCNHQL